MSKAILNKLLFSIFIGFLLFIPLSMTVNASDTMHIEENIILNIGYPVSAFSKGFLKDTKAALELWGSRLAKRGTEKIKGVNVTLFKDEDISEVYNALRRQEVDLLILNTLDYVEFEHSELMEPVFAGFSESKVGNEYVLLVRGDKNITTIDQLQNKTIYIETEGVGRMPVVWLDVLLKNKGLTDRATFFQNIKYLDKASKTVLPVFFGKVAACVTNKRAFKIMAELNPQLDKELMILAQSRPFLRGLVVFRKDLAQDIKRDLSEALRTMHEYADGQQLLMIMREQRLIPFRPEHVGTVRTLYHEFKVIQSKKNAER